MSDEWEDVPADDFEDAPASDEWEDVDTSMDQGPPLSAANPPEEFHPSKTASAALGWTGGVPGLQPAAAAIRSGIDSFSTKRKLLEDYQLQRDRLKKMDSAASSEHPGAYYSANIPANVATAIAAGELVPAKVAALFAGGKVMPHIGRILGNAGLSAAQEASQGTLDAEHVGKDVLAAEGANIMLHGALKPLRGIAKGSQVPQKVADAFYRWLGKGAAESAEKTVVEGDDMASRLARAAQRGEADLGPGGFTVKPQEFADDMASISRNANEEAVRLRAPDRILNETPVSTMRLEAEEIRDKLAAQEGKTAATRAKYPDDTEDMGMWNFGHTGKTDVANVPPPPLSRNVGASDPDTGPLRNTATKAESKKRWGDADKPEGWDERWKKNHGEDQQGDRLRAEYQKKHAHESNQNYVSSKGKPSAPVTEEEAKRLEEAADKVSRRATENREVDLDSLMMKARGKVSDAAKRDLEEMKRIRAEREAAGRSRTRTLGATAGTVGGFIKGGPVGAVAGHYAGTKGTRAAMEGIDTLGNAGKKLEQVKSWAEKLAAKNTPTGRAVAKALAKDYDGFIQRMTVLVDPMD